MDAELLKLVGRVAGIGGLALGVLLILYKDLLKKIAAPRMEPQHWYRVVVIFMVLVWSIAVLGIVAWIYAAAKDTSNPLSPRTNTSLPINQVNLQEIIGDLKGATVALTRDRIREIDGYVVGLNGDLKQQAIVRLANLIFKELQDSEDIDRYRTKKSLLFDLLRKLNGAEMAALFTGDVLADADLYGLDFSNLNLRGVSFRDSNLIAAKFEGAILDGGDFTKALIRNVHFANASLRNVVFTEADWFNAIGLTKDQLAQCKRSTLQPCPKDHAGFMKYLKKTYAYPFEEWESELQKELRSTWAVYSTKGGLCEAAAWRASTD